VSLHSLRVRGLPCNSPAPSNLSGISSEVATDAPVRGGGVAVAEGVVDHLANVAELAAHGPLALRQLLWLLLRMCGARPRLWGTAHADICCTLWPPWGHVCTPAR
jgi:hypothetical protein